MRVRRHVLTRFVLILTLALPLASAAAAHDDGEKTLYQRLGGYDALAAVTDDFLDRFLHDENLKRFFFGFSTDSLNKVRQHVLDQLCQATGGPCVYTGRDTKTAHAGIGITAQDWDATVVHLVAALDKFKVPHKEKDELLALVATLKADIVEQ